MPTIKQAVALNENHMAFEPSEAEVPETPDITHGHLPAVVVTGLPVRGIFPPTMTLGTDFSHNTLSFRTGVVMRSPTFPPQAQPIVKLTPSTIAKVTALTSTAPPFVGPTFSIAGQPTTTPVPSLLLQGIIDPSTGQLLSKGSTPYSNTTAFTYTSTATSITWAWTGLIIYRGDGSTISVPNGTQAITGLINATTYYFYPFWDEAAQALYWVAGGIGSPAYAQTATSNLLAQTQNNQGQIALSLGGMPAITGNSGGGGGGGGGGCVRKGSKIVPLGHDGIGVEMGDWEWIEICLENGKSLVAVPEHRLFTERQGKTSLDEIEIDDLVVTDTGSSKVMSLRPLSEYGTKIKFEMNKGHLYWANGILSHNLKPL